MSTDVRLEGPAQKQFLTAPKAIQAALRKRARDLAEDPHLGAYVPLGDIHNKATLKRWTARVGKIHNLYKLDLADGWRALYSIGSRGGDRIVMVLEVVDDKQYERVMGYT